MSNRRYCLLFFGLAIAGSLSLMACRSAPKASYLERHEFPTWPASKARYNFLVSGYVAQHGFRGKFQTDWVKTRGLGELVDERLRLEENATRESIERLLGPPAFEVDGDFTLGLSPIPVGQILMGYAGPSISAEWAVIGRNPTAAEYNAAPYRDLELARALETMYPQGVHPREAAKSSIYIMSDFLGLPGPRNGDAVIVMYDADEKVIGVYRIWYIDELFDRSRRVPWTWLCMATIGWYRGWVAPKSVHAGWMIDPCHRKSVFGLRCFVVDDPMRYPAFMPCARPIRESLKRLGRAGRILGPRASFAYTDGQYVQRATDHRRRLGLNELLQVDA